MRGLIAIASTWLLALAAHRTGVPVIEHAALTANAGRPRRPQDGSRHGQPSSLTVPAAVPVARAWERMFAGFSIVHCRMRRC